MVRVEKCSLHSNVKGYNQFQLPTNYTVSNGVNGLHCVILHGQQFSFMVSVFTGPVPQIEAVIFFRTGKMSNFHILEDRKVF